MTYGKKCPACGYINQPEKDNCYSCEGGDLHGVCPGEHVGPAPNCASKGKLASDALGRGGVAFDAVSPMTDQSQIAAFVGKNTDYYSEKWTSMTHAGSSKVSFNWAAFFVALPWLLYRKLYAQFFMLIFIIFLAAVVTMYLEEAAILPNMAIVVWDLISILIYGAVVGSFGNYWYLRKFRKSCDTAQRNSMNPSVQESFLQSKGGANGAGVLAVVALAAMLVVIGTILANPSQVSRGSINTLSALLLLFSIVFGVLFAIKSVDNSRFRYIKISLLSSLFFVGLMLCFNLIIMKPVEHFWYSSVLDRYTDRIPHASAIRDLESDTYGAFKSKIVKIGKNDRLDLPDVYLRANSEALKDIIPRALNYLSFSKNTGVLKVAEAHLALLISVSDQFSGNCENTRMGFSYKHSMASTLISSLKIDFHNAQVDAIKSGRSMKPIAPPPTNAVESAISNFFIVSPEYKFMLDPLAKDSKMLPGAKNQVFCNARIELIDYMLAQPEAVAASFFRQYYQYGNVYSMN